MTEAMSNVSNLAGRQVGSKARAADMETTKPKDCCFCVHALDLPYGIVCKLTRMPVSDTRGGCHKYEERINYMQ